MHLSVDVAGHRLFLVYHQDVWCRKYALSLDMQLSRCCKVSKKPCCELKLLSGTLVATRVLKPQRSAGASLAPTVMAKNAVGSEAYVYVPGGINHKAMDKLVLFAVRVRDVSRGRGTRHFDVHLPLLDRVAHHVLFQWLGKAMPVECGTREERGRWFSRDQGWGGGECGCAGRKTAEGGHSNATAQHVVSVCYLVCGGQCKRSMRVRMRFMGLPLVCGRLAIFISKD